jgi:hypothetical protein
MEIQQDKLYGVVSGDLIGSSKFDKAERSGLFESMQKASSELGQWLGDVMPLPVDVFGGDSWQLLVTAPEKALAAALLYRASLRAGTPSADTRSAVAIGTLDFVPGDSVAAGDGDAFRLSGRMLKEGLGKRRMGFATSDSERSGQWDLVFQLLDSLIIGGWTDKRARAVSGALRGWKQAAIGELWDPPIDQATVNRHLKEAGWAAVSRAVGDFEKFWSAT